MVVTRMVAVEKFIMWPYPDCFLYYHAWPKEGFGSGIAATAYGHGRELDL